MNEKAITALAVYFSGVNVTSNSVALQVGNGPTQDRARDYFAVREALGVRGYASQAEAHAAITLTLEATE